MKLPFSPHPFRPRLIEAIRGYDRPHFFADLGAGVTVGIVALPLAMAFAIASGVKPEQGIFTAIIAGFLISLPGGSSVQIGSRAFCCSRSAGCGWVCWCATSRSRSWSASPTASRC